jgi:hypothetical protein
MDLLADIGHVESHFNPFGDSSTISARWVHYLCQTYHRHHFGMHSMVLLGDEAQVVTCFSLFGDSANFGAR